MAAPKATWKGTIRLSLISIPVRVFAATNPRSDVQFHQLHRKCHTRIQLRKWCPHCKRYVENDELIKGYERDNGRFVLVEEEEIARVRPASTRTIDVSDLVKAEAIDPVMVERTYFLAPDNRAAGATFAVLRDALDGQAAVGRVAVHGREYLAAIVKRGRALLMLTLRTKGEVRDADTIEELEFADVKAKPTEMKLARQVLGAFTTNADLGNFTDHYEEALRSMLAEKPAVDVAAGGAAASGKRQNVVNLMDALRGSLAAAKSHQRHHSARGRILTHRPARSRRKAS